MANFTQGSLSIEEYYFGFQNLWAEYSNIIYAGISSEALSAVQTVHETSKRDQFLMKLRSDFDATRSNLMNRDPVPTLDACLSELLREEQRIKTHTVMEQNMNSSAPVSVAYAAQGKNKPRDMRSVQCYSCKGFGHLAKDCSQKFCNYCKKRGHIISACPIRPAKKQDTAYHVSVGTLSSTALPAPASVPTPPANTLTLEMVQQMIVSAFSALGLSGSSVREDHFEGT
ncbi:uncharacterized protein LOC114177099 [Vigna unguiculata]|uniref:uncharacterized protein LOC114177099 n=1 Tax=Vigna unguiculata TaxID=3917 RepID=UPI001016F099|nr:uncharacterized protein LOC114177099 [Vigna unguiculata]